MDIIDAFKDKAHSDWARKVVKFPLSYRLASWILRKNNRMTLDSGGEVQAFAMDQTARAYARKRPVCWTTAFFPSEILYALDLVPFAPEVGAGVAAAMNLAPGFLQRAEEKEIDNESCSFHRCAAGGIYEDYFPQPDLFVASSHLCDGAPHLFRFLARERKVPFFILDVPDNLGSQAEDYLASQLENIVLKLEETTGIKVTAERWEEIFDAANKTREAMLRFSNFRKNDPTPIKGEEGLSLVYLQFLGYGHPRMAQISNSLAREIEEKQKKLQHQKAPRDNFRLIWLHLRPYYQTELFNLLEEEKKARVVFEEMNQIYWPPLDPSQPYRSLARKILHHPGVGPVDRRVKGIIKMVEEYNADAVVHFSHWGCRQSVGAVPYIKNKLRQKGIPFLALDGDCVDDGSFPKGQIRTRLESFLEILQEQKTG